LPPSPTAHHPEQDRPAAAPSLGARLRALRLSQDLSQRELARRAGIAHAAISQIEQDQVSPSVASLRKLVGALGLSLAAFFSGEEGADRPTFFPGADGPPPGAAPTALGALPGRADGRGLSMGHSLYPAGADSGADPLGRDAACGGVVVAGSLTAQIGGASRRLARGDAFLFPAGQPHRFRNEGTEPAELVWACAAPPR
jgi:transcriptional regulator with XRE-family HTH domain